MPHEVPGVFHMLLRHGRGFGQSDLEEVATAVGHRPLGSNWSGQSQGHVFVCLSVAIHLQGPLQRGSGSPGRTSCRSRFCSHQPGQPARLQTGTKCGREIGRVASPHRWRQMLPTSARVAQEVYEPLIGIQYPMLQPNGRHLANRCHLHPTRGSPDCLRPKICPLVPCLAQCGCKE